MLIVADWAGEGLIRYGSWRELADECAAESRQPLWAVEITKETTRRGAWLLDGYVREAREDAAAQAEYTPAARTHGGSV